MEFVSEAPGAEETFSRYGSTLFSLAYRMLGAVADAEDVVQEAYLRWNRSGAAAQSPGRFLTATVTRLCIDHLRSARIRREEYMGTWLPEPLVTGSGSGSGEEAALLAESLSMAFLHLLERLSATERAVFLLREVFAFDTADVATLVGKSEAACRQILTRARSKVGAPPRREATREEGAALASHFVRAVEKGDIGTFLTLVSEDVVVWSDAGGRVPAARLPIHGSDRVARFCLGIASKWAGREIAFLEVNGDAGFTIPTADGILRLLSFEIRQGRIASIFIHSNPEKLRRAGLST